MKNKISKALNFYYFILMINIVVIILTMVTFNRNKSLYLSQTTIDPEAYINPSSFEYRFITSYANAELIGIFVWMVMILILLFFFEKKIVYFIKILTQATLLFFMILNLSSFMFSFDAYSYSLEARDIIIPVILMIFGIVVTYIIESKYINNR